MRNKIVLSFTLIIIIGTVLMVSIINYTTRHGYESFVKENDLIIAQRFSKLAEQYYKLNNGFDDIKDIILYPKMKMPGRRLSEMPPIIITDRNKHIIFASGMEHKHYTIENLKNGLSIVNKENIIGYIYVGSMIEMGLTEAENHFLGNIQKIIIIVSLFIILMSVIVSFIISKKITEPVSQLSMAAKKIEAGDFSTRVHIEGNDEFSLLAESFNNMATSVEDSDRWRKQIIADSAHELRTPVTLIQGNLEMILDGVYKADKEHIQNIFDETLVLSRLIKELQQLNSAETGSMVLNIEDLSLNKLILNIMDVFKPEVVKEQIALTNKLELDLPLIKGDFHKLKQVFSNVLANAFRHTPKYGKIEITSAITKKDIIISISDNGCGIPENELEKIFERFYRTDSSRNRISGGSGLGLAISREIIKLHGGSIHAISPKESGAKFIISLPIII